MKIKMKALLEGFAWERTSGKALPTLADVARKHQQNLKEADLDSLVGATGAAGAAAGAEALAGASEDGKENIITKKFDAVQLGDNSRFTKVVGVFQKSPSITQKADFFMFLLDKFGADEDTKKKLKMKL
tara:strand:- start:228 stop:614 length:387 start_codon:yes stop_codon:yes gene_type:complete